ncbi:MAG: MFS transporter [Paracoccaceae bacterium]
MSPLSRLIAASGLTNLGDGIAVVVWAWIASLITRDPLLVAALPLALRLPWAILALPAGVVTDRVDRRRLIVAMDATRATAFGVAGMAVWAALPLGAAPDAGTSAPALFAVLLGCALTIGSAEVLRDNAAQTLLPSIVPHAGLERANGRLWSVEITAQAMLGPAVGAFAVAAVVWLPFAICAVAFAAAALAMARLPGAFRPAPRARDWQAELGEGLAFLAASPLLKLLAVVTGVWNLAHQMMFVALVLHVQENLGLGARGYGLMLAAGALGGVIGGLVSDRVVGRLGAVRAASWSLAASALGFGLIAAAPGAVALALTLAAFQLSGLIWNTVSVSTRQRMIPDALLGRVNSVYRLLAWGMMPIGMALSGLLVRAADGPLSRGMALTVPFWAALAISALLACLAWRPLRRALAAVRAGG